jgi:hypothetical protein
MDASNSLRPTSRERHPVAAAAARSNGTTSLNTTTGRKPLFSQSSAAFKLPELGPKASPNGDDLMSTLSRSTKVWQSASTTDAAAASVAATTTASRPRGKKPPRSTANLSANLKDRDSFRSALVGLVTEAAQRNGELPPLSAEQEASVTANVSGDVSNDMMK